MINETERRAPCLAGMTCDGAFDLINKTKHQNSSPVHPNYLDCLRLKCIYKVHKICRSLIGGFTPFQHVKVIGEHGPMFETTHTLQAWLSVIYILSISSPYHYHGICHDFEPPYYASWSVQKREEESRCTPINVEAMLRLLWLLWYDIPILLYCIWILWLVYTKFPIP
jgi:hypothetical protein